MQKNPFTYLATILGTTGVLLLTSVCAQPAKPAAAIEAPSQIELEKEAALNLARLKKSIEKDAFFSARVALNVWRSSAKAAGSFDPELYAELEHKLYTQSIAASLNCFTYFLGHNDYYNARTCLQIWRMHSEKIQRLDPDKYKAYLQQLEGLRKK